MQCWPSWTWKVRVTWPPARPCGHRPWHGFAEGGSSALQALAAVRALGPDRAAELCCTYPAAGRDARCRQRWDGSPAWSEHVAAVPTARPGWVPGLGTEVVRACDANPARGRRRERERARERWGFGTWYCATRATNTVLSSARRQNSRRLTITALPGIGNTLRELEHQWG